MQDKFFFKYHKKGPNKDDPANIREIVQASTAEEAEEKLGNTGVELCRLLHGPFDSEEDARQAYAFTPKNREMAPA